MNVITTEIANIAKNLYSSHGNEIDAMHTKINPFKDSTIDFQWLGSAALGYHVGGNGRVELEAINSGMEIKKESKADKASLWAIMFNLYYSPTIKNTPFAPYVGIGVGPVNFRFASQLKDKTNINLPWFAYQAKLGIAYSFIPELKISLGYRYVNTPLFIVDSVATHNAEVGLIFNF
jgi:opacity protein-like surface antigen